MFCVPAVRFGKMGREEIASLPVFGELQMELPEKYIRFLRHLSGKYQGLQKEFLFQTALFQQPEQSWKLSFIRTSLSGLCKDFIENYLHILV